MRKLCLVPALLLAAASASAETPVKLWNDYVYNQPVESVKAEAGIFDCSQRGQQMFCRANVEFAGHKDWGEVFFFTNGRLKAVSLFAPISRAHFTDAAAAVRKTGMTPAVLHRPRARHEGNRASQGQEGGLRLHRRQDAP